MEPGASLTCPAAAANDNAGPRGLRHCGLRSLLIAFGCLNVGLGFIGIFVPGLPTTIFLLLALWAFSKSSDRFHRWLYNHRRLGPPIRDWHEHRAIPFKAKVLAVSMMSASLAILSVFVAEDFVLPLIVGAIMLPVAAFIVTRPSRSALEPSP